MPPAKFITIAASSTTIAIDEPLYITTDNFTDFSRAKFEIDYYEYDYIANSSHMTGDVEIYLDSTKECMVVIFHNEEHIGNHEIAVRDWSGEYNNLYAITSNEINITVTPPARQYIKKLIIKKNNDQITLLDESDIQSRLDEKLDTEDAFSGSYDDLSDKPTLSSLGGQITITKQSTADSGYSATYAIQQGNTTLSPKINIPKDFLVKSGEVKTVTTANNPVQGYTVGDKYLDFIVNTIDDDDTNSHIYINVKELIDAYDADNNTLQLSNGNVFSIKDGGITLEKLSSSLQTTINNKANSSDIPTKTSDLTNDGDGTNVFVKNNDSRLSNVRTPAFVHIGATSSAPKDLNDYKTGGFYYCGSDANEAPYIENQPLTSNRKSFFLLVETWGITSKYVKQTLTYYTTNTTYTRTCSNNTWDNWVALIKEGDSRLTDARTPTSHTHGSLADDGTLNSDITSINKIVVTDSSNNLKTINKLPTDKVTHQDISGKANTADLSTVATTGSYNDLTDTPDLDEVYDYIDTVIGDIEEDMLS